MTDALTAIEPEPLSLAQRRDTILEAYAYVPPECWKELAAELAELDGCDTDMLTQLQDAGYGSAGIF